MKKDKIVILAAMMAAPSAAFAFEFDPVVYSFVGGAVGGFVGAGLACWWCRRRDRKPNGQDPRPKY
jgi:hypothetical protein